MKPSLRILFPIVFAPWLAAQAAQSEFGHARTRELAELGVLPTPLEVAVADIVNFHRHRLTLPRAGEAVALDVRCGAATARQGDDVYVQLGYTTTPTADRSDLPPLNLALVIDCSGSMAEAGKMEACQRGLLAFAERLRATDEVAIVTFSNEASVRCARRPFGNGDWFRSAARELAPGGATNLHAGLMLGLREVATRALPGGSNRVLLLTDGIANRGTVEPAAILRESRAFTAEDVDLSTIGVGRDLDTTLLDQLARGGRGLFHFVADSNDIAKVFVDEAEALLAPAARRVQLRVTMPIGLELLQAYGHEPQRRGDELSFDLPDLNRGATGVVLLRCRCTASPSSAPLAVRAGLRATDALTGKPIELREQAELRADAPTADPLADPEVKKNMTIAVLAQGMHAMAEFAQQQRWADADRELQQALTTARRWLPEGGDADVRAVRAMAEGHARTLRRYVDRFRDYE